MNIYTKKGRGSSRESHGHQELSRVNSAPRTSTNRMSFAALTKSQVVERQKGLGIRPFLPHKKVGGGDLEAPSGATEISPVRKPGSSTRADLARVGVVEALGSGAV